MYGRHAYATPANQEVMQADVMRGGWARLLGPCNNLEWR